MLPRTRRHFERCCRCAVILTRSAAHDTAATPFTFSRDYAARAFTAATGSAQRHAAITPFSCAAMSRDGPRRDYFITAMMRAYARFQMRTLLLMRMRRATLLLNFLIDAPRRACAVAMRRGAEWRRDATPGAAAANIFSRFAPSAAADYWPFPFLIAEHA